MFNIFKRLCAGAAVLALAACGGSGDGSRDGADLTPVTELGALTLRITDAPVDSALRVVVEFTGLEVKAQAEGQPEIFTFDPPRQIDLLALAGGGSEILLEEEILPAGRYEWIRLKVNAGRDASDSFIELDDGGIYPLFIPSGNQTGLKLVQGFVVPAGGLADFTIDFDLRRSVIAPPGLGGVHILKPALRLVDNTEVGAIAGEVLASVAADPDCAPAVYIFTGFDAALGGLGSATPPLVSTGVEMDDETGAFEYRAAFLAAGEYTAAFTCDAAADTAEEAIAIEFLEAKNAEVFAGQTTIVDFLFDTLPPPPPVATVTAAFTFSATDFTPDAPPIAAVEGSFTLEYDPAELSTAVVTQFSITAAPELAGWADNFDATNVVLSMAANSVVIGGSADPETVTGGTNDFALSFALDVADAEALPEFTSFSYAVEVEPVDDTVYESATGNVARTP
jgi:hypothetical protein